MAPRARNLDDSRSETSSTITNQKEKAILGPTSVSGVNKGKRVASGLNGTSAISKGNVNGHGSATAASAAPPAIDREKDLGVPQIDWNTMPVSVLRTYRIAHRLPVPSTFNHPHAELTYKSCETALHAPSVVHHRRKMHEQHLQRQKARDGQVSNGAGKSINGKSKDKGRSKDTAIKGRFSGPNLSIAQSIEPPDPSNSSSEHDHPHPSLSSQSSSGRSTYVGPRLPSSQLASSVRKHFNAQQLAGGEADTIARFIYVVQQNRTSRQVRTEGSEGDGNGKWMGGNGREQTRVDGPGGEAGFRLRFKP